MIRALYLVFDAQTTWDKIVQEGRNLWSVLVFYLIPLAFFSVMPEWFFLTKWGRTNAYTGTGMPMSGEAAFRSEVVQFAGSIFFVFVAAWLIQLACQTYHVRSSYRRVFVLVAYALGPMLVLRMADGVPGVDPWLIFGAGMFLSLMALYSGLPRVLQPGPAQAMGLFILAAFVIVTIAATNRLGTLMLTHYSMPAYDLNPEHLNLQHPRG